VAELTNLAELTPREFLDEAEEHGSVEEIVLDAFATEHELEDEEVNALRAELEARGVEIVAPPRENDDRPVVDFAVSGTTDSLTLFMNAAGRYKLLTAAEEVALA
jgi:hypothetical protein